MKIHKGFLFLLTAWLSALLLISCQKKETLQAEDPAPLDTNEVVNCPDCEFPDTAWKSPNANDLLVFRLRFDSTQARLNDLGQVSVPPAGIGAQSPEIVEMSVCYLELMPEASTLPGEGVVLFKASETTCGGNTAIHFCKGVAVSANEIVYSTPLKAIPPGTYKWLRLSVAYQQLKIKARTLSTGTTSAYLSGFSAETTYLAKTNMAGATVSPTLGGIGNKNKGYWMVYQKLFNQAIQLEGQAPHTTVVNPNPQIQNTASLSFVYGQFVNGSNNSSQPLVIQANQTGLQEITLSFSNNRSFEWNEVTVDGLFQPEIGETVLDFGCRGLIPYH